MPKSSIDAPATLAAAAAATAPKNCQKNYEFF